MCCLSPPWLYVDISPEIAYKQMLEILFVDLNYFTKFRYDSMNITAFNV